MRRGAGKYGGLADRSAIQKSQFQSGNYRLDLGARPEPLIDGSHVRADGVDAQIEGETDLVVTAPLREQLEDLALPSGDQRVRHGGSGADGGHFGGASPSSPEHELRNEGRHRHTATEQLANRIGEPEQLLPEQVATGAGLQHTRDQLFFDGRGNDQQRSSIGTQQRGQFSDSRGRVEGDDDDVGLHAGKLFPRAIEGLSDADLEVAIAEQHLLGTAVVEPEQENPRHRSVYDLRGANALHLVPGSHDGQSLRPELQAPQGLVTRFELATNRPGETLRVYRLSSLRDVELWSNTGCQGRRTQLSDMFSASLVLGTKEAESGRVWRRAEEVSFQPGDVLLADAGEVQRATAHPDRVTDFFTIYWNPDALSRVAAELGFPASPHWMLTELAAGPISVELARLRSLLESGASAAAIEELHHSVTVSLLRCAGRRTEAATTRPGGHPRVRRAVERVRASLSDALLLSDLADEMNLSKYHLARSFQRSFGVPPHRFRKLLRLQRARRLLERGFTVADAAHETGFADAPHLSRTFCEWLGVTPAAWRSAWCLAEPWGDSLLR